MKIINRKYLPSKNFLIALSITIGIILITILINYFKTNTTRFTNQDLLAETASTSAISLDSDHDGLPDWSENLYGTNPQKADTDGDGTSDIVEIKTNRDPLIANTASAGKEPTDKIDPQIIASEQKMIDEFQALSPNEQMARNLISNIIAAQPASGEMDQTVIDALVSKSLTSIPQKNFNGITEESDLNLISSDPKTLNENLLSYAKSYATQTELLRKILGKDLQIINDGVISAQGVDKKKILNITNQYQNIINNLIKMPVPGIPGSFGVIYHLQIINSLEKIIMIDNDIINVGKDFVSGLSNLNEYSIYLGNLTSALNMTDANLGITRQ